MFDDIRALTPAEMRTIQSIAQFWHSHQDRENIPGEWSQLEMAASDEGNAPLLQFLLRVREEESGFAQRDATTGAAMFH
jgi:hypothetical protein